MVQKDKNRKSLGGNNSIKKLWLCGNLIFHILIIKCYCYLFNNNLTPNSDKTACGKITPKLYYCYVLNLDKLC